MYEFTVIEYLLETSVYHTNKPDNYAEVEVVNSTVGPPFTISGMMRIWIR